MESKTILYVEASVQEPATAEDDASTSRPGWLCALVWAVLWMVRSVASLTNGDGGRDGALNDVKSAPGAAEQNPGTPGVQEAANLAQAGAGAQALEAVGSTMGDDPDDMDAIACGERLPLGLETCLMQSLELGSPLTACEQEPGVWHGLEAEATEDAAAKPSTHRPKLMAEPESDACGNEPAALPRRFCVATLTSEPQRCGMQLRASAVGSALSQPDIGGAL
eukprot:scaffold39224_cov31-Tisochrysis_lutea.AAC.2